MIDIVTLSCNDCPLYWEFWNPVSRHWSERFGIHPVLFYYGERNSHLSNQYGTIIYQEKITGVPDYVAATWGRFWVTRQFPNKMCIISDIDMFPLSKRFFLNQSNHSEQSYSHLNADAYQPGNLDCWKGNYSGVPACYHVATSEMLQTVYGFSDSYAEELNKLLTWDYIEYGNKFAVTPEPHLQEASASNGGMWGIDEMYSSSLLRRFYHSGGKVQPLYGIPSQQRLCRARLSPQVLSSLDAGTHIDFHSVRPYTTNKEFIDAVVEKGTG